MLELILHVGLAMIVHIEKGSCLEQEIFQNGQNELSLTEALVLNKLKAMNQRK